MSLFCLSKKVKTVTLQEVRDAKYFAVMSDNTSDVSHNDQMAFVVR